MQNTSWEKSSKWYKKIVGEDGHYFHQAVIFPNLKKLINLDKTNKVFDLACGQGIFERQLMPNCEYVGIDISRSLIEEAKRKSQNSKHTFLVADVSKKLPLPENYYDLGVIILALQNIKDFGGVIKNAANHLKSGGRFVMVLNHPIFRIPRQSSWGVDENSKTQYRRIDRYMSELEIPIITNPGSFEKSEKTWSFHYPLSRYSKELFKNGFMIERIEELVSDKKSTGSKARMEDRAREEIPMFMTIVAVKR